MSHLVSPCFANFPGGGAGVLCLFCLGCVCCLGFVFFGCVFVCLFCFQGISAVISFLSIKIAVVDRQCLVLVRQCRKKKNLIGNISLARGQVVGSVRNL